MLCFTPFAGGSCRRWQAVLKQWQRWRLSLTEFHKRRSIDRSACCRTLNSSLLRMTYVLAGVLDGTSARRREQSVLLTAMLQADIDQYLARAASAELDDSFTATRSQLYATEDELRELRDVMTDVLRPLIKPHAGAKPVALGLVIAPLDDRAA